MEEKHESGWASYRQSPRQLLQPFQQMDILRSEDENLDIITCKKGKVSVHVRIFTYEINALKQKTDIRIKFCDMKKRSVKISVKIRI